MNDKVDAVVAELRRHFEQVYGDRLVQLVLFGSKARGDAAEGSDIDLLVVLKGPVERTQEIERNSQFRSALSLDQDVFLSLLYMDEDRYLTRQGPLLRNIQREGVPV